MIFIFIVSHLELNEDFSQCHMNRVCIRPSFYTKSIKNSPHVNQTEADDNDDDNAEEEEDDVVSLAASLNVIISNDWIAKCPVTLCPCWVFSSLSCALFSLINVHILHSSVYHYFSITHQRKNLMVTSCWLSINQMYVRSYMSACDHGAILFAPWCKKKLIPLDEQVGFLNILASTFEIRLKTIGSTFSSWFQLISFALSF